MPSPRYIAKYVDGRYEIIRQDLSHLVRQPAMFAGLALAFGTGALIKRGSVGWILASLGAASGAVAWMSRDNSDADSTSSQKVRNITRGPSYPNEIRGAQGTPRQTPSDDLDEANMESFPASDPISSRAG